jgi:hypothetical protein
VTQLPSLIQTLANGAVEFILIGGAAATAHGSARLTQDVDAVYSRDPENLRRLVQALAPCKPYQIPGGGTYRDLEPGAIRLRVFEVDCLCLSLTQLIRSKRAAGRPKDLEALAELEALADEGEGI